MDPCKFASTKIKEFSNLKAGWFYPKNSIIQPLFDQFWMQLDEKGIIDQILAFYKEKKKPECSSEEIVQVDLTLVQIIFALLLLGIAISCLLFVLEFCNIIQHIQNWPYWPL